jgi:FAD dependent oxidoreductase TIGR03364
MVWPIGQPPGELYQRALRSRLRWLELGRACGLPVQICGSLHLARRADELAVLEEFVSCARTNDVACELLRPPAAVARAPALRRDGLLAALWSPTELAIDPREAIALLPRFLAEKHGVELRFAEAVTQVESPRFRTVSGSEWHAERIVVATGSDFRMLFPEVYATAGIRLCKLQMMRTVPQPGGWQLGPHIAGGLTLCHYAAFQSCPSLIPLRNRVAAEMPDFVRHGIHVMASQNGLGEVVIGDSHEYGNDPSPFDNPAINALILGYLSGLLELPEWTIAARWHGTYAKHSTRPLFVAEPQPAVHVVTAPGGAGMTMSFGWADDLWDSWETGRAAGTEVAACSA